MSRPAALINRRLAWQLTLVQALLVPVIALIAFALAGAVAAKSAALGALLCWLGSAYFALQAFRQGGASASKRILMNMYKGLIGKFLLVGVGFILAFRFVQPLSMLAMLVGIIAVQMMAWVVPLWTLRQPGNK